MDKSIVVISGTSGGKARFNKIAKNRCFVKNVNIFNQIQRKTEKIRRQNEELPFEDQYWKFENEYIGERIEKFQQDDSEEKTISIGEKLKTFSKALLVLHWISDELTENLKGAEGIIQLHVTNRNLETDVNCHDIVLYSDDVDFEDRVNHFLDTVLNCKKEKEII